MWYVYIATTENNKYYTGISLNPDERLKTHNSGSGARFAVQNGKFELVYKSNPFSNKSLARKREIQIKNWTREKKEKLINGEWR